MMIILVLYTYRYCFPEVTGHKPRQCLDENENLDLSEAIVKFVVSVVFQEKKLLWLCSRYWKDILPRSFFPFKGKASLDLSSLDRKPCLSAEFQARAWFVPRGSKAHEAGATDTWNIVKLEKQEVCQKSLQ